MSSQYIRSPYLLGAFISAAVAIPFSIYLKRRVVWNEIDSDNESVIENDGNKLLELVLEPSINNANLCTGLIFTASNLTDQDIQINWRKTYYTYNGSTEEGFLFDVKKTLRNQMVFPRLTDIIFANRSLKKTLRPLYSMKEIQIPHIPNLPLPSGSQTVLAPLSNGIHGIYINITHNGEDYMAHASFELSPMKIKALESLKALI